jgi:hypothetical protein
MNPLINGLPGEANQISLNIGMKETPVFFKDQNQSPIRGFRANGRAER